MKMLRIVMFTLSVCAVGAHAGPRLLSLEECLNLGAGWSPELKAAAQETYAADARIQEAQRQYLPSLSVQGSYERLSDVPAGSFTSSVDLGAPIGTRDVTVTFPAPLLNATGVKITLQQPVFTGFRISSSIRQAERLKESSLHDLMRQTMETRYSIREAYWSLAKAKAMEQAAQEGVTLGQAHLADVEKLLAQGAATDNDTLQARLALEDARITLASAFSMRRAAVARLAQLTGLPWDADIDVAEAQASESADALMPALDEQVSRALSIRPEIKSAHARAAALESAVQAALSGLYPGVFVTGDYTLADPNPRQFPQADQFTGTWSIGVAASLDLGRYPAVLAQADEARARLAQAQEAERGAIDAVTLDVVRARLAVEEASARCAALAGQTALLADNSRVVQQRMDQGIAVATEGLDAKTSASRARLREQAALCDLAIAQAALERALGQ